MVKIKTFIIALLLCFQSTSVNAYTFDSNVKMLAEYMTERIRSYQEIEDRDLRLRYLYYIYFEFLPKFREKYGI